MQSYNNITCYNVVTNSKLYNHKTPNKGRQVIDSPASTFESLTLWHNFSSQYQYNIEQTSDENKEQYQ